MKTLFMDCTAGSFAAWDYCVLNPFKISIWFWMVIIVGYFYYSSFVQIAKRGDK